MSNHQKDNCFNRSELLSKLSLQKKWDFIVIGGGATGLGVALDSVTRGFSTLLLEQADFAKGTSSRSTKLVHGGVRYLAQGNVRLVREALRERGLLLKNAPHLVKNQTFIIPNYQWWSGPFYTIGLKLYDFFAGNLSLGKSVRINKNETVKRLPTLNPEGLKGGVVYHDGQFDDSRLAINLAQTIVEKGGVTLNHFGVHGLLKNSDGKISGVIAKDQETGIEYELSAKAVVNATGIFVDGVLQMDKPGSKKLVKPSQGVHLVLDKSFLPGEDALMIPKTKDGRVLFAVPWHNKLVVGTTDTLLKESSIEPQALEEEIEFILRTTEEYLIRTPLREDVLSVFAGLRPLAAPAEDSEKTKEISRSHKIIVSASGLVTITGGKWTTFRKMAEDTVDKAISTVKLPAIACKTEEVLIHGAMENGDRSSHLYVYGSDLTALQNLVVANPELGTKLHARLPFLKAEVIWAARYEMARTVEDVLARRVRALFLDARAAIDMADMVAELLAHELNRSNQWKKAQVDEFVELANNYLLKPIKINSELFLHAPL
ncbi:MAG: FAD-dependent oxidoreductase [Segetibacter sp.]|nr:FAD-dependent oxidoreductase [Segetibacter sp.]